MKRGSRINIQLSLERRTIYTIISLLMVFVVAIGVFAFGTSNPSTFGHSAKELDFSQGVDGNAVFNGNVNVSGNVNAGSNICFGGSCINAWSQVNSSAPASSGGSYTGNLVNNIHTGANCVSANGIPTEIQGNKFVCRFISSSCPSGWTQYQKWSTTYASVCGSSAGCSQNTLCSTGGHVFSNATTETCTYSIGASSPDNCDSTSYYTCTAALQEIGCY